MTPSTASKKKKKKILEAKIRALSMLLHFPITACTLNGVASATHIYCCTVPEVRSLMWVSLG